MKKNITPFYILKYLILITALISCKFDVKTNQVVKPFLLTERCSLDTNHFYELYIPSHDSACIGMPILIILDPHGSGSFALKKFIESAEKYKCILAASNLIKNNYPQYIAATHQLIEDVKNKTHQTGPTFICGFSGGARMAISYAQTSPVAGVLACGALASVDQLKATNTKIYSIMGMSDFNFPEIAECIINPSSIPENLYPEVAGDLHEWPSSSVIDGGIAFLMCLSMNKNSDCFSVNSLLNDYAILSKVKVDSLIHSNEFLKAQLICNNLLHIPELPHKKSINTLYDSINESIALNNEIKYLKNSLQFELKIRDAYNKSFLTQDTNWWKNEIDVLNKAILNEPDTYNLYAYKRIKAYLGILCYSLSKNYLQNNEQQLLIKILAIYKLIEPNNTDMLYFTALYYLKTGNKKQSEIYLHEAIDEGFNDTVQIRQDFSLKF